MKKLISVLLAAILLAFSLALPASAQESEVMENPAMPVITEQSPNLRVRRGRHPTITMRVDAHIPSGDPIGFRWYLEDRYLPGPGNRNNTFANAGTIYDSRNYHVVVYNQNYPQYYVRTTIRIETFTPFTDRVIRFLVLFGFPIAIPGGLVALGGPIGLLIVIPTAPLWLPLAVLTLPFVLLGMLLDAFTSRFITNVYEVP